MPHPYRFWRVVIASALSAITIGAAVSSSARIAAAPAAATAGHSHALGGHNHGPHIGGPSGARSRSVARYLGPTKPDDGPTPGIPCDKGSMPEKVQGKAPAADYESGRAEKGYFCNARLVSHGFDFGGYRVERYVDKAGNECAFWDTTLLWPHNMATQGTDGPGVYVMDMSNPAKPVHTATLSTPGMQSPHESVRLNHKRGLLVAVMGYPTWHPGFVDVWDVSEDCRQPVLASSTPMGILGHESGFSPDGKTLYVAGLYAHTLTAVDLTNPQAPVFLWATADYQPHGVSISNDGKRLYMAEAAFDDSSDFSGLTILDVSEVQKRVPNPSVPIVSRLTWPQVSTPQNATPFTRNGHKYLMQIDEFGSGKNVGAARIIDIQDEKKPFVVSNMRLAVNNDGETTEDPGDDQAFQGYQGHYCSLPSRVDPYIVACSFIMSGLRVFDIRDVKHPKEVAYFNKPLIASSAYPTKSGSFAMSAPAYDEENGDIWYSDGNTGFWVVTLTEGSGVTKFAKTIDTPGN